MKKKQKTKKVRSQQDSIQRPATDAAGEPGGPDVGDFGHAPDVSSLRSLQEVLVGRVLREEHTIRFRRNCRGMLSNEGVVSEMAKARTSKSDGFRSNFLVEWGIFLRYKIGEGVGTIGVLFKDRMIGFN